jgi:hypothetical protein
MNNRFSHNSTPHLLSKFLLAGRNRISMYSPEDDAAIYTIIAQHILTQQLVLNDVVVVVVVVVVDQIFLPSSVVFLYLSM